LFFRTYLVSLQYVDGPAICWNREKLLKEKTAASTHISHVLQHEQIATQSIVNTIKAEHTEYVFHI